MEGFVNQLGTVERGRIKINIKEGEIQQKEKPFYMTWNRALKRVNTIMEKMEANLDNEKVVTKRVVNILCFPKEFVQRLEGLNKRH